MNDEDLRQRYRRDYTNEPVRVRAAQKEGPSSLAHESPVPAAAVKPDDFNITAQSELPGPAPKPKARKHFFQKSLLILAGLILIAGTVLGIIKFEASRSPIPNNIKSSVEFPLIYPSQLPTGYAINKNSFSFASTNQVVIYKAVGPSGATIAFAVQARPANLDFNQTFKQSLQDSTFFSTSLGQAVVGTTDKKPLGALLTDRNLWLVSSNSSSVTIDDLRLILSNAKQINTNKS